MWSREGAALCSSVDTTHVAAQHRRGETGQALRKAGGDAVLGWGACLDLGKGGGIVEVCDGV